MDLKKTDLGGKKQQWETWLSTVPDAPDVPAKRQQFQVHRWLTGFFMRRLESTQ